MYGPYTALLHYLAIQKDHVDGQTLHSLLGMAKAVVTCSPFNFDGLLAAAEAIRKDVTLDSTTTLEITVAIRDTHITTLCLLMHKRPDTQLSLMDSCLSFLEEPLDKRKNKVEELCHAVVVAEDSQIG